MFINYVRLYVAHTIDVIDTSVPAIFRYSTTACSNNTAAIFATKN